MILYDREKKKDRVFLFAWYLDMKIFKIPNCQNKYDAKVFAGGLKWVQSKKGANNFKHSLITRVLLKRLRQLFNQTEQRVLYELFLEE